MKYCTQVIQYAIRTEHRSDEFVQKNHQPVGVSLETRLFLTEQGNKVSVVETSASLISSFSRTSQWCLEEEIAFRRDLALALGHRG